MNEESRKELKILLGLSEKNACACGDGSCCGGAGKWIWIVLAVAAACSGNME